ncbi:MAG: 50S ribosomal protein L29 [Candidatus Kapabacteria bacterium]|nr:50S ribosomal protein L29 [Ignavibacteriota bacterium]MCW5884028.1 50S ribosomal protein L29 [Candidatus Kapabacteria bacterium]
MKPRNAKDLKELNDEELSLLYTESIETLSKQNFQHALKQLHDTAYLNILRNDIARIKTILNERLRAKQNG